MNYCCFGYSLPWYDWSQWELLIDWMALNGVNAPLSVTGQEAVWQALREIPYGETRSYAEIAAATGHTDAVRAVGRANGDNRIAIAIPCHRVVGSDGELVGYGGGLWRKEYLIAMEQAQAFHLT